MVWRVEGWSVPSFEIIEIAFFQLILSLRAIYLPLVEKTKAASSKRLIL